ncbi:MAG: hypothetical protein WD426_00295 [Anditalea sp.]
MAPLQMGPANLLWEKPTGYAATMVGLPYDDLKSWRSHYPVEVFISQMNKVADEFQKALMELRRQTETLTLDKEGKKALSEEVHIAETIAIHSHSIVSQARFITLRDQLSSLEDQKEREDV